MTARRFALVIPRYPLPFPTPPHEDYLLEPARTMHGAGFETEILSVAASQRYASETVDGITLRRFGSQAALLRAMAMGRYALVHAHTDFRPSLLSGLLAAGAKTVLTRHSYIVPRLAWKRKLLAMVMNRFDRILALTAYERDVYLTMGVNASRLEVMPLQVNVSLFSSGGNPTAFRTTWRIAADTPVVLFVANLRRIKNPEVVLQAMALVRKQEAAAMLVIVGKDLLADEGGPVARELARKHGVEDAVILTGWLAPLELRDALAAADVFVNSSASESFLLAAHEAAAAGKPLCLPRVGSLQSLFGGNALYHEPTDAAALASNILRYLADPSLRALHSVENRRKVEPCDVPAVQKRMLAFYHSLLGG